MGWLWRRTASFRVYGGRGAWTFDVDEVLVTTGAQAGDRPGLQDRCSTRVDVVVTEAPTYPGAVPTFRRHQADVVQVTMDRDGLRTCELTELLDRLEADGRRPKFILHGAELPQPRRRDDVSRAPRGAGAHRRGSVSS